MTIRRAVLEGGLIGKLGVIGVSLLLIGLSILGALPNAHSQPTQNPQARTSSPVATVLSSGPPLVDPVAVAVSPDSQTLYITDYGANGVFNLTATGGTPQLIASGPDFVGLRGIIRSPDGNTLYVAGFQNGQIISLPAKGGSATILASGSRLVHPHGIAISPDGKTLYIADNLAGAVFTLSVSGGIPTVLASGPPFGNSGTGYDTPNAIAVSHDGSTLYVTAGTSGIYALPVTGGTPHLIASGAPYQIPLSPVLSFDGTNLLVMDGGHGGAGPGTIYVQPVSGSSPTLFFQGQPLTSDGLMSLSPDGSTLFVANAGGAVGQPGSVFKLDVNIPPSCVTPPSGLVSWWPLDGNANDIKDGNNGNVSGTGGHFVPAKVGQGFQSGGPGSLVQAKDAPNLNPPEFTIDAWVKINALTTSNPPIIWKGDNLGHDFTSSYGLGLFGNPGSLSFPPGSIITGTPAIGKAFFTINNAVTDQVLVSRAPIAIGSFVHFAASANGTTMRLYVNGQLDTEANQVIKPQHSMFPFQIGSANGSSLPGLFLDGIIDEVSLYNRAIAPSEVQSIFNAGGAGKCSCATRPPGLVSWWPGEGNANDLVGTNNGRLVNGAGFSAGEVGQAFNLTGANDQYVQVPNSPNLSFAPTSSITIEGWVYRTGAVPVMHIIGKRTDCGVGDINYQMAWGTGGLSFGAGAGSGVVTGPMVPLDTWTHLAATFNGTAFKFYVDGALIATGSGTLGPANTADLKIGDSGTCAQPWYGLIDEMTIYSRALSASEVQGIFSASSFGKCHCVTPPLGLTSWWPGDGNANDVISHHDGVLVNGATFGPGEVQQAFNFNGAGQFVNVTNNPDWNFGSNPFTIDLWVRFNQPPGQYSFVSHDERPNNVNKWYFGMNPFPTDTGLLSFTINGPAIGPIHAISAPWTPNPNQWYHVAVTRETATYTLYINGVNVASATNTIPIPAAAAPLQIGSAEGGAFHNGLIDEVQIYNRALAASEIQAIFNAGSSGCCKPSPSLAATWTQIFPTTSPPARYAASMTYDAGDGYVLLFGGYNYTTFLSDTWEFKAGSWTRLSPSVSPPPRQYASMTYDAADGYVLLFGGGNSGGLLGDTWEFKAGSWTQLSPSISPSPRITGSIAYDEADGYVLLFGGTSVGRVDVSDTWEFKAGSWTQLIPAVSPSPRDTAPMAYDAADSHILLFGGYNLVSFQGDTWEFKAGSWTQLSPSNSPSPRQSSSMTYDAKDGQILLFGDDNNTVGPFLGDTWEFKAGSWTQLLPAVSPSPRASASMTYDAADEYVLLFGGQTVVSGASFLSDTWTFGPSIVLRATTISVSCDTPVVVKQASKCTATVTDTSATSPTAPFGTVTFSTSFSGSFDASNCTLVGGSAASSTCHVAFTPSASGTAIINGAYAPTDVAHSGSSTTTPSGITVILRMTSTSINCTPSSVVVNQASTCTATVIDTSSGGAAITPTGTVTFSSSPFQIIFGPSTNCRIAASTLGTASCSVDFLPHEPSSYPWGPDTYYNSAQYTPDAADTAHSASTSTTSATVTISPRTTSTTVSCSTPITVNTPSVCIVTVVDTSTAGTPASPSNPAFALVTNSTGSFSDSCSLPPVTFGTTSAMCQVSYTPTVTGGQRITADFSNCAYAYYACDVIHSSSSGFFDITVNQAADFSLTPTSTTITVAANSIGSDNLRVDSINGFTGTVSFTRVGSPFGGVSYFCSSVTLSSTIASATSTCTFSSSTPGTYTAVVNATGGNPVVSHKVTYSITVTKATLSISTTLSASTITIGGSVTDSATLTGTDTLTAGGTVTYQFFTGSSCAGTVTTVGTPVVVNGGVVPASASHTFSSAGAFSWNAVYSGDASNNGATSGCETLSVVAAAGFTISASPTSLTVAPEDSSSCEGQGSAQRCDDEASSTITVTGLNGFSGTVVLTVSTSPHLSFSLSTARITGSGSSSLTVSDGRPGNYTVTVTGTSGSIVHSVIVNVMVRPPVPLKCGGDSDCNIESDAPLSDVRFGDKKIHFTVDGTAGARGVVNVTIPRSAVPDIDRIEVSVDGAKLPRSALMIAVDDSAYHVYFSFTFHSPVVIDIDLSPAATILGLNPLAFYGIVGGIALVMIGGVLAVLTRRRTKVQH